MPTTGTSHPLQVKCLLTYSLFSHFNLTGFFLRQRPKATSPFIQALAHPSTSPSPCECAPTTLCFASSFVKDQAPPSGVASTVFGFVTSPVHSPLGLYALISSADRFLCWALVDISTLPAPSRRSKALSHMTLSSASCTPLPALVTSSLIGYMTGS